MMITWWFNVSKFVLTKIWNHDMLGWAWLSEVSNFTYRLRELPLTCKVVVGPCFTTKKSQFSDRTIWSLKVLVTEIATDTITSQKP